MKNEKKPKPREMEHEIQEETKGEKHVGMAIMVSVLIAIILISGFLINSMLNQPSTSQTVSHTSKPKAAIVDHLSLTYPNQTFIQTTTNILKQTGYTVDYYRGEEVTVEFYKNLPTHNYGLIILRVHSGLSKGGNPPVGFFTSEAYSSQKYLYEQLTKQIVSVHYLPFNEGDPEYFGIWPGFIKQTMRGRFNGTVILVMGCDGLRYADMAEAFIEKGAKVYISWDKSVSASHNDLAIAHLLQHFLTENRTLKDAVEETLEETGPDPIYQGQLTYYPLEAGACTVQTVRTTQVIASTILEINQKELAETE